MPISFSKVPAMIAWIISGESKVIGKLTAVNQSLPTKRPGKIGDDWLIEIAVQFLRYNALSSGTVPE